MEGGWVGVWRGGERTGKDTNIHTLQTVLYLLSELSDIKELLLCLFFNLKRVVVALFFFKGRSDMEGLFKVSRQIL